MEVWKFPLEWVDDQTVSMPRGAKILTAQMQQGVVCLWALVDPKEEREIRGIRIYGTGHPVYSIENKLYIGTVQAPPFVWHVFEETL